MRLLSWVGIALLWSNPVWAGATGNLNKSGVILQGYDAVSYFNSGKPLKGEPKFQTSYEGATYLFANETNRLEFLKNPKKYSPQYGGWCAFAVADNKSKVDVDPNSFVIQDGRLLLFYNGVWGDTRKKWLRNSPNLLKEADMNWPEVEKKEP